MDTAYLALIAVFCLLLAYLVAALLQPEKFS